MPKKDDFFYQICVPQLGHSFFDKLIGLPQRGHSLQALFDGVVVFRLIEQMIGTKS